MKTITLIATNFSQRLLFSIFLSILFPAFGFTQDGSLKMTDDDRVEFVGEGGSVHSDIEVNRVLQNSTLSNPGTGMLRTNSCPSAFIMNTPYNNNNGQRGCMFDVTATNTITIRCFESSLYAGTTANYEIYYRAGTHVGNENNSGAWIFLGGATGITSAGNNLPTALPIPINVTIPAGQTYAFYITNDFGGGTSYTDGTAVGNFLASDANLTVYEGVGKSYPFGLTFTVRNFNGHIFYDLGSVLDGEEATLTGTTHGDLVQLAWELPTNHAYQGMQLERSVDGMRFSSLTDLPVASTGNWEDKTTGLATTLYYRLRLTDGEGARHYSNTIQLSLAPEEVFAVHQVYPNPFASELNLDLVHLEGGMVQVSVHDQMGKVVFAKEVLIERGSQQLNLNLPSLPGGFYILRCLSAGKSQAFRLAH